VTLLQSKVFQGLFRKQATHREPSFYKGEKHMSTITVKDGTTIYYKDWGNGQPVVFSHGWPLSSDDWDAQMLFFLQHGYRVIALDRRGHGRSDQTWDGNDMEHCADVFFSDRSGRGCRRGPARRVVNRTEEIQH